MCCLRTDREKEGQAEGRTAGRGAAWFASCSLPIPLEGLTDGGSGRGVVRLRIPGDSGQHREARSDRGAPDALMVSLTAYQDPARITAARPAASCNYLRIRHRIT